MNQTRTTEVDLDEFVRRRAEFRFTIGDARECVMATVDGKPVVVMLAPESYEPMRHKVAELALRLEILEGARQEGRVEYLESSEGIRRALEDAMGRSRGRRRSGSRNGEDGAAGVLVVTGAQEVVF